MQVPWKGNLHRTLRSLGNWISLCSLGRWGVASVLQSVAPSINTQLQLQGTPPVVLLIDTQSGEQLIKIELPASSCGVDLLGLPCDARHVAVVENWPKPTLSLWSVAQVGQLQ